ncbi:hypothetical protein BC833DRAFT_585070 [Globomyces pollinis-pini]|nr:hypothetical protein BC833DRAFT_585070 [Globomyces pollinis-pini]
MTITQLPNDILYQIFKYFTNPKQLLTVSEVCRQWNEVSNFNNLWINLCALEWKNKKFITLDLHPRVDYTDLTTTLTVKEMKKILDKRLISYKGLLEKSEFIDLICKSTPAKIGRWSPKWKASYIVAQIDSNRRLITKEELCGIEWNFRFKQWPVGQFCKARFKSDYTYVSDLFDRELHWRFYAGEIQVEQYPTTRTYRTDDWSWVIENEMVIYYACVEGE